jgi:hypothetical protein
MHLVNALASKMNFSVIISLPSDGSHWGWVQYNGTVTGMIGESRFHWLHVCTDITHGTNLVPRHIGVHTTVSEPTDLFLSCSEGLLSLVADISNNLSDVGFGHVTQDTEDVGFLEYSTGLAWDCYGWGVPLGAGRHRHPAWVVCVTEFSSLTWGLILVALLLAAVTLWLIPRMLPQREYQEKELWGTPR